MTTGDTGAKRRSRIFWFEGVSEAEVLRSLNDTRPSRLRQQGARRVLVGVTAAVLLAMALLGFVSQPKLQSYLMIALLATVLLLYTLLRKAVRKISDAPDELLDERQVAARDAAHTVAYRILAIVAVGAILLHAVFPHPTEAGQALLGARTHLLLAVIMGAACLPAMVLAWNLPSEQPEA
jgi:Na+/H+ antiporter NhaD/arsenite permease-like protein